MWCKLLLAGAQHAWSELASGDDTSADVHLQAKPTHVLNAAGLTGRPNVDWCEDHKVGKLALWTACGACMHTRLRADVQGGPQWTARLAVHDSSLSIFCGGCCNQLLLVMPSEHVRACRSR